jgi:hypothetical protein
MAFSSFATPVGRHLLVDEKQHPLRLHRPHEGRSLMLHWGLGASSRVIGGLQRVDAVSAAFARSDVTDAA